MALAVPFLRAAGCLVHAEGGQASVRVQVRLVCAQAVVGAICCRGWPFESNGERKGKR